jgi:hypothetical protein
MKYYGHTLESFYNTIKNNPAFYERVRKYAFNNGGWADGLVCSESFEVFKLIVEDYFDGTDPSYDEPFDNGHQEFLYYNIGFAEETA